MTGLVDRTLIPIVYFWLKAQWSRWHTQGIHEQVRDVHKSVHKALGCGLASDGDRGADFEPISAHIYILRV